MAYFADTQRKTFRNTNTVNYNFKDIIKNKDHNLNVLVGEETINKKSSLNDDRLSFFTCQLYCFSGLGLVFTRYSL